MGAKGAQEGAHALDVQSGQRQGVANPPKPLLRFGASEPVFRGVAGTDGFARGGFGAGGARPRLLGTSECRLMCAALFRPALGPHFDAAPLWQALGHAGDFPLSPVCSVKNAEFCTVPPLVRRADARGRGCLTDMRLSKVARHCACAFNAMRMLLTMPLVDERKYRADSLACWLKITSSASAWPAKIVSTALKSLA